MNSILIISNPNAAKGLGKKRLPDILNAFSRRGVSCDSVETKGVGDGIRLAREASLKGYSTIVAAGGDGTVNEVANGILKSGKAVEMGIIPAGRGNDFAWIAGIPVDIDKAVDLILSKPAGKVDVGFLKGGNFPEGRYFLNGAGIGFEPAVNFQASSYKHINGLLSYVVGLIHCIIHIPAAYDISFSIDDVSFDIKTQQISICNGRRMGSAFIMGPEALIDDGLLDVVYANKVINRRGLFPLLPSFLNGKILQKRCITGTRAKHVLIVSRKPDMKVHMDGEVVSFNASSIEVEMHPEALILHY